MPVADNNELLIDGIIESDIAKVQSAIEAGADVNHDDEMPILHAVLCGNLEIIELLINSGGHCYDIGIGKRKKSEPNNASPTP